MTDFANSLRTQGENYHWKAEYYRQNGELEGALINYLLSSNNLYNFKQYYESRSDSSYDAAVAKITQEETDYVDSLLITNMKYIVPLQEKLKQIKKNRNCPEEDKDAELNCTEIKLVKKGDLRFQDVSGQFEAKNKIEQGILYPLIFPKLYPYISKGILFYGPPGTGKTLLAKAFANELQDKAKCYGMNVKVLFYAPTGGQLKGKYVGETEKNIEKYFDCASRQATACENSKSSLSANTREKFKDKPQILSDPDISKHQRVISVLFLDECEAIAGDRARDSSGLMSNSVNTLLQKMDGVSSYSNVVVMAATNYPWNLDDAVLRRFDTKIFITLPSKEDISSLIRIDIANYIKKILIPIKKDKEEVPVQSKEGEKKCNKCNKGTEGVGKWCWCCDGVCMEEEERSNGPTNEDIFKFYRKKYFNVLTDQKINNIAAIYEQKLFSGSDASTAIKAVFKEMAVKSRDINRWITTTIEDPNAVKDSVKDSGDNIAKIKDIDKQGIDKGEKKFQLFSMTGIQSSTYNSKNKNGNDGEYALWIMPTKDDTLNYTVHWDKDLPVVDGFDPNSGYALGLATNSASNTALINLQLMKKCGFHINDVDNTEFKGLLNGFFNYYHKTQGHFISNEQSEEKKVLHNKSLHALLYLNWNIYYTKMFSTDNFLEIMLTIYSLSERELIISKITTQQNSLKIMGVTSGDAESTTLMIDSTTKQYYIATKFNDLMDKSTPENTTSNQTLMSKFIQYDNSIYINTLHASTIFVERGMDNNHIYIQFETIVTGTTPLDHRNKLNVLGIRSKGDVTNVSSNGVSVIFEQPNSLNKTIFRIMVPYAIINSYIGLGVFDNQTKPIFYINTEQLKNQFKTTAPTGKRPEQSIETQVANVSKLTANICAFKILGVIILRIMHNFIETNDGTNTDIDNDILGSKRSSVAAITDTDAITKYKLYAINPTDKEAENQILTIIPYDFIETNVIEKLDEFADEYISSYKTYSQKLDSLNLEPETKKKYLYVKGKLIASEFYEKFMSILFNKLINNVVVFPPNSVKFVYDNIVNMLQSINSSFALFTCAQTVYIDYHRFLYYMFRSVYSETAYLTKVDTPAKRPIFNILVKIDVSKSLDVLQRYAIDGRVYLEIEFKAYADYSNRLMKHIRRAVKGIKDRAFYLGTDVKMQLNGKEKDEKDLLVHNPHIKNQIVEEMINNISGHPDITKHLILMASNIVGYRSKAIFDPFSARTGSSCERIGFDTISNRILTMNRVPTYAIKNAEMIHVLMNGIESYASFDQAKATDFFVIKLSTVLLSRERSNVIRITPEFYTDPDYLTYMRVICYMCFETSIESIYTIGDNRQILINIITNKNSGNLYELRYLNIDIRSYVMEKKNLAYVTDTSATQTAIDVTGGWLSDGFYSIGSKLREMLTSKWTRILAMVAGAAFAVWAAGIIAAITVAGATVGGIAWGLGGLIALAVGGAGGGILAFQTTASNFTRTTFIYELLSCFAEGYLIDVNNNSSNNKCRFGWLVAKELELRSDNKKIQEITEYVRCLEESSFTVTPDVFSKTENLVDVIYNQLKGSFGTDQRLAAGVTEDIALHTVYAYRFIYTYPQAFATRNAQIESYINPPKQLLPAGGSINAYNNTESNTRSISRRVNKGYHKRSIRYSSNKKHYISMTEFEQPIIVYTGGQSNEHLVKQDSWMQQGGGTNEDCQKIEQELAGKNPDDFITFELTESLFQNVIAPANPSKIKSTITKKKMDVLNKYYNGEPLTEDEKAGKDEPGKK